MISRSARNIRGVRSSSAAGPRSLSGCSHGLALRIAQPRRENDGVLSVGEPRQDLDHALKDSVRARDQLDHGAVIEPHRYALVAVGPHGRGDRPVGLNRAPS